MRQYTVIMMALVGAAISTNPASAQVLSPWPVAPATKLESFDTNISVIVFKAASNLGTISTSGGTVVVKCREITDTSTARKEQGIAVEVVEQGQPNDIMLIDYDEIPSLVKAMDYFSKLDVSVTPLTSFDASYTTKGGFRIAAIGTRSTGAVQFSVKDARTGLARLIFSREEMGRFTMLINEAKTQLDSIRGG